MALINHATKEITAKIVYYGPGLCGKTTNLQWIHGKAPIKNKGKLVSLATETDRTLFFDYMPIDVGMIRGMRTRIGLYTVPGQVYYESTRRMVLKGADAVIFVCDSQQVAIDANLESLADLRQNLIANDLDPGLPMVLQYNKRDLPTALPVEDLNEILNSRGLPYFEAVAVQGIGVEETLKSMTQDLFKSLSKYYEGAPAPSRTGDTGRFKSMGGAGAKPGDSGRFRASPPPVPKPTESGRFKVSVSAPPPEKPAPAPPSRAADTGSFKVPAPAEKPAAPPPPAVPPPVAKPPEVRPARVAPPPEKPAAAPPPPAPAPVAPRPPPSAPPQILQPVARPGPSDATPPKGTPILPSPGAAPKPPSPAHLEEEAPFFQSEPPARQPPAPSRAQPREEPQPSLADVPEGMWLYLQDGKHKGPVSLDDLIDLILGSLPDSTLVYRQGLDRWTRASQVPEIAEQIPPPLPEGRPEGAGKGADFPDFNTVPAMLRTVLIADENPDFRRYLGMPLHACGFRVFEAANGGEAWKLVVQHRPWLILSDVRMPETDGFEICRRVRAHSLLAQRPFLFVSGSDNYKDRYRGLQVGADDFLSKQTPVRELLIRIQLLLTRYSDLQRSPKEAGVPGLPDVGGAAMQGQVEVIGAPGALQICNQGRFTGLFTARTTGRNIEIRFRDGEIVAATTEGHTGPQAVYDFLSWAKGHFQFVPGDPGEGTPIASSVEHLLLEGCRLLDESKRIGEE